MDIAALDSHLARAVQFVQAGNKQRALEEIGDARALVKDPENNAEFFAKLAASGAREGAGY